MELMPNHGIGPFILQMSSREALALGDFDLIDGSPYSPPRYEDAAQHITLCFAYSEGDSLDEIHCANDGQSLMLCGVDIFGSPAESVISALSDAGVSLEEDPDDPGSWDGFGVHLWIDIGNDVRFVSATVSLNL